MEAGSLLLATTRFRYACSVAIPIVSCPPDGGWMRSRAEVWLLGRWSQLRGSRCLFDALASGG